MGDSADRRLSQSVREIGHMGRAKGGAGNFFYPGLRTNKHKLFFNIHH